MFVLKNLLFFVAIFVFSLSEGYAGPGKTPHNNNQDVLSSPSKRRKIDREPIIEDQKIPIFSPLLEDSPTSAERKFLSPIRREIVKRQHEKGLDEKCDVSPSSMVTIFKANDPGNYWSGLSEVGGRTVAKADFLFSPSEKVLTKGEWKTNLERMEVGLCPVGHKGIVKEESLTDSKIKELQRCYRIELHHVTQEDEGKICELTHSAHMGDNGRVIIAGEGGGIRIVHSSLEKEEALSLCKYDQIIRTNLLHPKIGLSKINRKEFKVIKEEHWKARANGIKNGIFKGKNNLPTHVNYNKLYDSPSKVKIVKRAGLQATRL